MNEFEVKVAIAAAQEDLFRLSEGNPGAINVMVSTMMNYVKVDPRAVFGPMHVVMFLEEHQIKGSNIWFMFKNVCEQNLVYFIAFIRGVQLGLIDHFIPADIAKRRTPEPIDFPALIEKIKERTPFNDKIE